MYDHVLIRYGEINTKGQNRSGLERLLQTNVQHALLPWPEVRVRRVSNRILVKLHGADLKPVMEALQRVFGISSMSPVALAPLSVPEVTNTAIQMVEQSGRTSLTPFKVEVKRGNKQFELNSLELASHIGGAVLEHFPYLVVDVHNPALIISVDVRDEGVYLFVEKVEGANGFPVGMSGRVGGLLSGGIDSPVAMWKALKRGLEVDLLHFHSFPFTSERAQRKVEDLAKQIALWSKGLHLNLVSLTEIQSAIQKEAPEALRTILLRRMMFRIATNLATDRNWLGLVTGDSLGQVASQTLEGLYVVDNATPLTVIRPLVTEDKLEIIRDAQRIGTYETSIQPFDDCCSLFAPKRPKTRPTLAEVQAAEGRMDVDTLVQRAVEGLEHQWVGRG